MLRLNSHALCHPLVCPPFQAVVLSRSLHSAAAASFLARSAHMTLRVRLDFHKALKLSELQQSWMAVPDDIQVIGDLYGHLVRTYSLRKQVRHPTHTTPP
jgi:hypothetical protein